MTEPRPHPASTSAPLPDLVVVGNVTRDVVPDGWRAGGTAVYAAHVALGLGRRVGVVTAATADVVEQGLPPAVQVARHPAATSTAFENVYTPAGRVQHLPAAGEPIPAATVPAAWTDARICLIGPVFHEVSAELVSRFHGIVGLCAQGYLRQIDGERRVRPLPPEAWDAAPLLRHARVLFLSEEDIGRQRSAVIDAWVELTPIVAITDGQRGAHLHAAGEWRRIAAYPACEVDPTGAGDAFATGFLLALDEGADPWAAARFGAATASLTVEQAGPVSPTRAAVEARMARAGGFPTANSAPRTQDHP